MATRLLRGRSHKLGMSFGVADTDDDDVDDDDDDDDVDDDNDGPGKQN